MFIRIFSLVCSLSASIIPAMLFTNIEDMIVCANDGFNMYSDMFNKLIVSIVSLLSFFNLFMNFT